MSENGNGERKPTLIHGRQCPKCGRPLRTCMNKKDGSSFLGCSGYPDCKHSESFETAIVFLLSDILVLLRGDPLFVRAGSVPPSQPGTIVETQQPRFTGVMPPPPPGPATSPYADFHTEPLPAAEPPW